MTPSKAEWIANRPAVEAFARVVRQSAAYANAHHADTVNDIASFTKLDPASVRKMARTEAGTTLEPALIQPVIDAAAHFKDIPARFDAKDLIWS